VASRLAPTGLYSTHAHFVVLDASVWISSLLPGDRNHASARNWLGRHLPSGGRLVAPHLFVTEVAGAVARLTQDANVARNVVQDLYSFPFMQFIPMDTSLVGEATDTAIQFSLKGADSYYVAVAKQLGIPLVTFDREQLTRPASIIMTIKP
jgi:predicted nucleic acid-binding protein